jgi:ankyrin repeat protein
MIHSLKMYAIYSISINRFKVEDYNEIPQDLHEFTKDFIKFFKLDKTESQIYSASMYNIKDSDLLTNFNNKKNNLLKYATVNGYLEVVRYLIENEADIAIDSNFPLTWAAGLGYLEIVKYLVENGANVCANDDMTLKLAADNGYLEVVDYLKLKIN